MPIVIRDAFRHQRSGRVFLFLNADERWVEIQAIHDEASGSQEPRVLAGAAGHVKDGLALRVEPAQQVG
jgi:hypothetical protein